MTKRIFKSIIVTAVTATIAVSVLITLAVYYRFAQQIPAQIASDARLIDQGLALTEDETAYCRGIETADRITLVAPDGQVLYDNQADAAAMENHLSRPEISEALNSGTGQSHRYSSTISEVTYYFAMLTPRGNVLRVSLTQKNVLGTILSLLPLILAIAAAITIMSVYMARGASRKIVAPLNQLDLEHPLENDAYEELTPMLRRMDDQHSQIEKQMTELATRERELRAITENMHEGLIMLDSRSDILSLNKAAAGFFEADPVHSIGRNLLNIIRNPEVSELVDHAQQGTNGSVLIRKDERYYQVLANNVSTGQENDGVVLLVIDVTESYSAQLERQAFTSNVSHELKTPLTSISGYAEIMKNGLVKPEDVPSFAGRIYDESTRLIKIVNDLMDLSKLDENKGLGDKSVANMFDIADAVVRRLRPQAEEKSITLQLHGEGFTVYGYRSLLDEMLYNLVENAVKYTPEHGSVTVTVDARKKQVVVRDTGIGIPREAQSHIFERFYRVDKNRSRATGGTGLGLSIVKHIAQLHNIAIDLKSEVDQGTAITLDFTRTK